MTLVTSLLCNISRIQKRVLNCTISVNNYFHIWYESFKVKKPSNVEQTIYWWEYLSFSIVKNDCIETCNLTYISLWKIWFINTFQSKKIFILLSIVFNRNIKKKPQYEAFDIQSINWLTLGELWSATSTLQTVLLSFLLTGITC